MAGVISRRVFLRSLAVAAAGMTIDPERLLWRPGAKTIVVMGDHPFWSSQLATATSDRVLTFEMLREAMRQIEQRIGAPITLTTALQIKLDYERIVDSFLRGLSDGTETKALGGAWRHGRKPARADDDTKTTKRNELMS